MTTSNLKSNTPSGEDQPPLAGRPHDLRHEPPLAVELPVALPTAR
jgi:hypothetical protein